ncbi:MAG: hypothetical protein KF764_23020 [Labilithrix sp.]|nr:hypothetical protein [Labilithrix sp.]
MTSRPLARTIGRARSASPLAPALRGGVLVGAAAILALSAAATTACGPGEGSTGPGPQTPPTTTSPSATSPPATSGSTGGSRPGPATGGTTMTSPPSSPPPAPMKDVAPSTMAAKLRDIGLDPTALPPLNKLDAKTLRDVMNTFTKALGVQCSHCHEKDFRAPTANKKIATHMWNDFTLALALDGEPAGGGALYCDSCHGGRAQFLDRRDLGALGAWMQDNYVDKLRRADGKDNTCDTCHGDPFEGKILSKLWK